MEKSVNINEERVAEEMKRRVVDFNGRIRSIEILVHHD